MDKNKRSPALLIKPYLRLISIFIPLFFILKLLDINYSTPFEFESGNTITLVINYIFFFSFGIVMGMIFLYGLIEKKNNNISLEQIPTSIQ